MKLQMNKLHVAVVTAVSAGLLGAPAFAQTPAPAPAAPEKTEKIEVTGSRIRTITTESTSPVTVVDAQQIKTDGVRSAENFLNNLPQVFAGQGGNVSNGATGTSTVNLRGLGATRNLVLMNGRRMPYGSANTAAVDLNQIPSPLIKRVEVLTGGAGAIYGSDAVSGVVNFIMNDKFEGIQFELNQSVYNHSQQGGQGVADIVRARAATNPTEFKIPGDKSSDGKIFDSNFIMGSNFDGGKGNATVFLGYKKEYALLQSERDFSSCSLNAAGTACGGSGTAATGQFIGPNGGFTAADTSGNARRYVGATDAYNFGPLNFYQRPSERYSANIFANHELKEWARPYVEFGFMDNRSLAQIAPGGLFGVPYNVSFDNPLLTASWRTAFGLTKAGDTAEVILLRRNVEGGGRQSDFRNTSYRTVLGSKGDMGAFSYDTYLQTSKVVYQQNEANYFSTTRGARALDVVNVNGVATCRSAVDGSDPGCVPYNPYRLGGVTQAQLDYLQIPGLRVGSTEQKIYGVSGTADLGAYGVKIPTAKAGISFAVGVERRTEKLSLKTDQATQSGDLSGSGGPTPGLEGQFTVNDIFTEVRVPIMEGRPGAEQLTFSASYRNSDYSTGKKTNTFGIGLDYAPIKAIKLRGTYQEAVRAPNLIELFTAQGNNLYDNDADPCAGATPTASLVQCARTGVTAAQYGKIQDSPAGQYNQLTGGNPNLQPEKSKSYTAGLVLTPMRDLTATIDYFNIKVKETIGTVNPVTTLNQCLATGSSTFCSLIQRDRLGTLWLLDTGRIVATNVNIGSTGTEGIDLGLNYNMKIGRWGGLNLNGVITYVMKQETEELKGLGSYDCVGLYGNKCGVPGPEYRHKMRLAWTSPWNLDLAATWRHFGKVEEDTTSSNPLLAGGTSARNRVLGARDYLDLAASYKVNKQVTLSGGINNVLDKEPPITGTSGPSIFGNGNTFPQVYDALGRRLFINMTARF